MVIRVASFFPFHATCYLNGHSFIERELTRGNIGFHKKRPCLPRAVDDVAALQAAADRLSAAIIRKQLDYWTLILGPKFSTKERSQMRLSRFYSITQIEGHHVFRAYWKHAFLKQYEKFSRYLRNELCSNNLRDFGLKKGLDHLDAVRNNSRRSPTVSPVSRPSTSTLMWISPCFSGWRYRSPSARSAIPA